MSSQLATELDTPIRRTRTWRAWAVSALGPVTALVGVVWALVQPYRLTFLDPGGEGFWSLAVVPPLLVIAVGALFHFLVAGPLLEDLAEAEEANAAS
jgi:hypothetical protein